MPRCSYNLMHYFVLKHVLKNWLKLNHNFVIIPFHLYQERVILLQNTRQVPSMLMKLKDSKRTY